MALGDLLAWWNLVFFLPGAAGLCLALVSALAARGEFLLALLLTTYGAIGIGANHLLPSMPALLPLSLAIAVAGSVLLAGSVGHLLALASPREDAHPTSFESLVGCTGTVVSPIAAAEATAQVEDHSGRVQEVRCKSLASTPLRPGERVVVARVEPEQRLCLVVEMAIAGKESRS
jgi:membrane protein implicated in regulation of membrane protease activity